MKSPARRAFLRQGARYALALGTAPALAALMAGCQTVENATAIGSQIAASAGLISHGQAGSITRVAKAGAKAAEEITPEQEYYIGRTIGAMILDRYRPYDNQKVTRYLNLLGQHLARASDRPETFGGYHFLALDSSDINALSAPGGLIFVTRGLLRCCPHEDAVAAVLAHEIGHVQFQHGLKAIQTSRLTGLFTTLGSEAARTFGPQEVAGLTDIFGDAVGDIFKTLVDRGYSRSQEYQADEGALIILRRVGYDPNALIEMLRQMEQRLKPGGLDFAKTHPAPKDRIETALRRIDAPAPVARTASRQRRFAAALGSV